MNRRELLTALAAAAALGPREEILAAQNQPNTGRQIKPLPFDPKNLNGLSEKLLTSHYDNNYTGAFRRLGQIEQMLASRPKDAPGFQIKGLKMEELIATNSVILHE